MIDLKGKHFYLFEPVQLVDSKLVVPMHFYQNKAVVRAKCLPLTISSVQRSENSPTSLKLSIPMEPPFDSSDFMDLEVNVFAIPGTEIEFEDGTKLLEAGGWELLGEQHFLVIIPLVHLSDVFLDD